MAAVSRGFRNATRDERPTPLLFVADRLFAEPYLEPRWFAFGLLERTLPLETERTWQLLRRAAREAGDWITVDDLAHPYGKGIAAEPYRWAELEQLVFSPSRWERRLVGSTIATMTHVDRRRGRRPGRRPPRPAVARPADGRRRTRRAEGPVVGLPLAGAGRPGRDHRCPPRRDGPRGDHRRRPPRLGHPRLAQPSSIRPWPTSSATRLAGIRRRAGAPTTSTAAETAARFGELPDPTTHPEPPLA